MKNVRKTLPVLLLAMAAACSHNGGSKVVAQRGFAGTWQLNREKSDIPGVTRSQTAVLETDGVFVKIRETLVNDQGETLTISVNGKFDGHDYPVSGTPFADTGAYRVVAPNKIEGVAKKRGVVVVRETAVLSNDGNTLTVRYLSLDGNGNALTNYGVFERVNNPPR